MAAADKRLESYFWFDWFTCRCEVLRTALSTQEAVAVGFPPVGPEMRGCGCEWGEWGLPKQVWRNIGEVILMRRNTMSLRQQWGKEGKLCAVGIPKRQCCSFKRRIFKGRDSYAGSEQITCAVSIGFKSCVHVCEFCVLLCILRIS